MMEATDLKKTKPVLKVSSVQLPCVVCAAETNQVVVIGKREVPVCDVHCNRDAIDELKLRYEVRASE